LNKANHKLIYYRGYDELDGKFELYDLDNDPEEMTDLTGKDLASAKQLKEELLDALADADRPYQK
jgi:arylsulfatase A-like enzyme